jgi:hypothetical protein
MSKASLMEELRRCDPLRGSVEPPPLADMLEKLDLTIRPLHAELHPRRHGARAPRIASAGAAIAGAGAVAALALIDVGGSRLDVAQAILRATEPGSGVVHMSVVSERTVGSSTTTTSRQLWMAQDPRRLRSVQVDSEETREGALTTSPARAQTWSSSQPEVIEQSAPAGVERREESPVAIIHGLISEGRATVVGKTDYEGRAAWQLDIHPQSAPGTFEGKQLPDPELLVDADTYAPLELVIHSVVEEERGKPELEEQRERYVEYGELPATPQNEALLQLAPHPGARVRSEE